MLQGYKDCYSALPLHPSTAEGSTVKNNSHTQLDVPKPPAWIMMYLACSQCSRGKLWHQDASIKALMPGSSGEDQL